MTDMPDVPDDVLQGDAVTRAQRADELGKRHQDLVTEFARIRREALNELVSAGHTYKEIGQRVGISTARVGQLIKSGPSPERALIARGAVTVAIGGKTEGGRHGDGSAPKAVVSDESLAAFHLVRELCSGYRLECDYEIVPPPGIVDLNRTNLVVIGSPRLLPIVGQVMGADPHLRFAHGARGWHFTENSTTVHRSPSDEGKPQDYGYLGRLPRPDGQGSFLYLAGIHAMGTLGAARHLTNHIAETYEHVQSRRWSQLVAVDYDPDTREITSTSALTQLYAH